MVVRIISFFGAVLLGTLFLVLPAEAITLNPPIFEFQVSPGDTLEDTIKIFNESEKDKLHLVPEIVNFTHKEGDETTGTPFYYPGEEVKTGYELAPWVSMEDIDFELGPFVRKTVPFSIAVPETASPGSYFGGVIFKSVPQEGEQGVGLSAGTAVMMILRVAGDADESAVLTDFSRDKDGYTHLPVEFTARVANEGNVHLQPTGTVRITDVFGRQAAVVEMNPELRSVLPGSARRYVANWGNPVDEDAGELSRQWNQFKFGKFTAELTMAYGTGGQSFTATQTFWAIPWLVITILIGGAVLLLLVIRGLLSWYAKRIIKRFKKSENA